MAQDDPSKPTSSDKGKERAEDASAVNGANAKKDQKKDKDDKDSKGASEEELSEEDQQMKDELDMLVERVQEPKEELHKPALEAIKTFIKTSTSSVTAVPKPLKFLRPHYASLETTYQSWPAGDNKDSLADVLSVLGMTYSDEDRLDSLKYRLLAPSKDIASWGHEYIRHLALEIGQEYQKRLDEDQQFQDLMDLVAIIVPFFLSHNAEADAVDILTELEMIDQIPQYLDENTYERVCMYMVAMVPLLTFPDNEKFLKTAHAIYKQYGKVSQAMTLAIRLNDIEMIKADLDSTEDEAVRCQMAFQIAQQRISLELSEEEEADEQFAKCLNNSSLSDYYKALGKELNILDPKSTQDIYKTHLESSRTAGVTNVDSARHNLASAFVNAFINAGFGKDTMMLSEDSSSSWVWKTKEDGMISTAASVGMLQMWDIENGLQSIDRYINAQDDYVKAGAALAVGVLNTGVREASEPAMALLSSPDDMLNSTKKEIRIASIIGLGLAYAGSCKEEMLEALLPYVSDAGLEMQLSAMAALSLGLIFVGSANADISEAIIQTFYDPDREKQLKDKWTRFMVLGLALLFFGRQEEADDIVDTLTAMENSMSKPSSLLCSICAWAGTGTVLKLQELLHICTDSVDDSEDSSKARDDERNGEGNEGSAQNKETNGDSGSKASKLSGADALLYQSYAVIGLGLVAMGEDIGQDMVLRQFGHLMHYGEFNIRRAVPLAMALVSPSNPQMKVYDTLSRYSHDNDNDVAVNAIFAMGMLGAGTNNARLAQLLRQLASYYSRDPNSLFMVRIAQGLLHMGKGTLTINPFHTDRTVMSRVAAAGLLIVLVAVIEAKKFVLAESHYLLYFLSTAMHPRFLVTLDEEGLQPLQVNVRVGQAVDVVGQAGRPKTITGWQTQSTPVVLAHGERAELEDDKYIALSSTLEGLVILRKNPEWKE